MKILIKGGHVIDPHNNRDGIFDIYIEDGVIQEIEPSLDYDYDGIDMEVIEADGLIVAPGLIDMHCHLRDPGFEYKEDIETGTKSAAMGGFTSVACMPNTDPVVDNKTVVEYIISKARQNGVVNVYPIGSITKGMRGEELADIGEMKFAGIVAVSDDGRPVENPVIMRRAMQYANMFVTPVISHCEDMSLVDGGSMNEGAVSTELGLRGITRAAEEAMLSRECILSEALNLPVHIAHVSTRGGIDLIRNAKARGAQVTCETCPHYFSLTEEAVRGFNTFAKMNPPLRTEDDVEAVKEGLRDGTIDVIATDHAPHEPDSKNVEFELAANGIVGFETALPLSITNLVETGVLTYSELIEKMCVKPAEILGLNKGSLGVNKPADLVIFDPKKEFLVDRNKFQSKSKNSPFDGFTLRGQVVYTIVNGNIVVRQGEII